MRSPLRLLVALPVAVLLLALGAHAAVPDDGRRADELAVTLVAKSVGQPSSVTRKGPTPGPAAPPPVAFGLLAVGAIAICVAGGRTRRVADARLAWRSLLVGAPPLAA